LTNQRLDDIYKETLEMLAPKVSIERIIIPVDFPERKHISICGAPADIVLDNARLFAPSASLESNVN